MIARPFLTTITRSALRRQKNSVSRDGSSADATTREAAQKTVSSLTLDGLEAGSTRAEQNASDRMRVVESDVSTAHWVHHGNFQDYRDLKQPELWTWLLSGSMSGPMGMRVCR